jgi:hypothetical protein
MWDAYTSGPESVVVVTSAKALYQFTPQDIIVKSAVRYHSMDFARTEFTHTALFFYKPSEYRFENEFRLVRPMLDNESVSFDDPVDFGRAVPVSQSKIVRRVISHPLAEPSFKKEVDSVLRSFLKHISRDDSSLL